MEDNDKDDDNNDKDILALGLDGDMGFSRGHHGRQGHRSHDDDNDKEEDNDKDNDNNKDDKNDKGISSMGPPQKVHCATTKIQISQFWDFIENWDFREYLIPKVLSPPTPPSATPCPSPLKHLRNC